MRTDIIVAVVSLLGTTFGSLFGIITANKLTNFRIRQLEKKVEKHNNILERTFIVENSVKSAHHRIDELLTVKKGGNS